jgi:hypothetical protein
LKNTDHEITNVVVSLRQIVVCGKAGMDNKTKKLILLSNEFLSVLYPIYYTYELYHAVYNVRVHACGFYPQKGTTKILTCFETIHKDY